MKRKIDLVEEEDHESEHEESESSGDGSEDEEPRIKEEPRIRDVLSHLSRAVPEKRASDLLHSMAASKDILFWTPSGQLLRNKRTIPVTNIAYSIGSKAARDNVNQIAHVPKSSGSLGNNKHGG